MHGAAKVRWALFPPKAQHQHSGWQLWLRVSAGGHAGAYGAGVEGVMAKWTSGRSERTFDQSVANGRNEPFLLFFAIAANVRTVGLWG